MKTLRRLASIAFEDLRYKYAGTLFGSLWIFFQPILQASVYIVLYSVIFKISPPGLTSSEYVIFLLLGISIILDVGETILLAILGMRSSLITVTQNIYPIRLLPLRFCLQTKPQLLVISYLGLAMALFLSVEIHNYSLFIPIFVASFLTLLEYGFICLVLPLAMVIKDIQQVLQYVIQFVVILSPFSYTSEMLVGPLSLIIYINPLSPLIRLNQSALAAFSLKEMSIFFILSIVVSFTFLILGQRVYLASLQLVLDETA